MAKKKVSHKLTPKKTVPTRARHLSVQVHEWPIVMGLVVVIMATLAVIASLIWTKKGPEVHVLSGYTSSR